MASCTSVPAMVPPPVRTGPRWIRPREIRLALAASGLLLTVGSCRPPCNCPPPPEARREHHLVIAPAALYALEGKRFILRARHLDPDGGVLPIEGKVLSWSVSASLVLHSSDGDSAVVEAKAVDAVTRDSVRVRLGDNVGSRAALVFVVPDVAPGSLPDQVMAAAEVHPSFALVGGYARPEDSDPITLYPGTVEFVCRNSWIAFVGTGIAGDVVSDCPPVATRPDVTGEVTVIGPGYGAARRDVTWTGGNDKVDFSAPLQRPPPVIVDYTVVLAAGAATPASIQHEIDVARGIFAKEATGLDLRGVILNTLVRSASVVVASRNAPLECASIAANLAAADVQAGLDGAKLTVIYVDDILGPPYGGGETSYPSGLLGYSCPPNDVDGAVILISWKLRSPTTLGHELGHVLGLRDDAGHTNSLPGFGYTNLMWTGQDPSRSVARSHFTLGQTFRMNFDTRSWLHRSTNPALARPTPTRTCGPPGQSLPCPTLAWDAVMWPIP